MGRFGTRGLKEGVYSDVAARPRSIPFVLKLVLAAALLYAVFKVVPLSRVLESISRADLRFLLAGLGISLISIWLSAARLRFLVEVGGERLPLSSIVKINLSAGWYGLALPGTLAGGVVRWHRLTRIGAGKVATLAAITYARLVHVVMLVLLGLLFLALEIPHQAGGIGLGLVAFLIGLLVAGYLGFHGEGSRLWSSLMRHGPGFLGRWLERWHSVARSVRRLSGEDMASMCGLSVLEHLLGVVSIWLLARSVAIDVSLVTLGWIRSAVAIATSLPITISGLGIREGGLILMLEPYGVEGAQAVALSFLMLARGLVVGALGGLVEAWDAVRARSTPGGPGDQPAR